MFKKTLLALTLGGLFAGATAQAATVYDEDGTKVDLYGRIAMGFEGGGVGDGVDNGAEFRDFSSRLGFKLSQQVTRDLTAFGRLEWRFNGDERSRPGFKEVRKSYIGIESDTFGTFTAGNFDSFYDNYVMTPFDVYVAEGYEFAGGGLQARGDSIGYESPNLNGFQVVLAVKHFSERGLTEAEQTERGSGVSSQGGVVYTTGPVRLALGVVDDDIRGGGNNQTRVGGTAAFEVSEDFQLRAGFETRDDSDVYGGGFDRYGLGATYAFNATAFYGDVYHIDADDVDGTRNAWALGTLHNLTDNFDVFLELYDGDRDSVDEIDDEDLYYALGARYYF
ncbi:MULTISPECIES: porin [unclassified Halomonas]|uniref:porin n=1 Tax=unclassified Halomonas TaxID=2609666 RepID=UPI0021E41459|nr:MULTISPECIES: porin [unclassified Halomonas]UYG00190.1 porin [Halomonas sp. GD1P12]WNL42063.1 porin [Halomonas sp. PAMB 3264]